MMMEASPAAALEMVEPELILELLIVALDAPAQLGEADEAGEGRRLRQGREPILRGLRVAPRPLDQHPPLWPWLRALLTPMGGPRPQAGGGWGRGAGLQRLDRPGRDRPLRRERDGVGHAGGPPPAAVTRPAFRQVELIGAGQAPRLVRHRHPHRHLTVVLFAQD